ncbi:hypothetical protein [Novosphingobium sp.]|jgi:uncharacterized membrane protein|uniref:hypothetical protein n=1 Tax=Novosphingobium sp. TaxID=1874826 RepID=UPI001EC4A111|nr:hypothetical protein [Novosphingobium sp.]MBK9009863.1 hypothetical protein [Novosphingobium sp.]
MDDFTIARAVHLFSVLMWIGGVAFVTLVIIPSIRLTHPPAERLSAFDRIEGRFAPQARIWVLLAGASGFWMVFRGQMWSRFAEPQFWWMHAMVGLWTLFVIILFIAEPLVLHPRMKRSPDPAADFRRLDWGHRFLFLLATITVLGAAGGSRGLF